MRHLLSSTLLALAWLLVSALPAAAVNDPVADPDAIVVSGKMRFTVLTPQMIRMEYSATSTFEDRATFGIVNRRLPVPDYTVDEEGSYLYIRTSALTLRYKKGGRPVAANKSDAVLTITFHMNGQEVVWYPGKDDALNLRGTLRTLDSTAGDTKRSQLEQGVLSRAGWAVIDESPSATRGDGSRSFPMEPKEEGGMDWVTTPADKSAIDWYFLGYGHDYKTALGDFVRVAGSIPLPPAYIFGYWYSRYQAYTSSEFMQIVRDVEKNDIPMDVMILDMDWHTSGWTGWTWNKKLIPNPKSLLSYMHQHGLHTALNLHPADGVDSDEQYYDVLCRDLGLDPKAGETIPWQIEDYDFYQAMWNDIIRVRESEGVDFWWIDWQQWLLNKQIDGLGQTFWHNHVFFEDMRLNRADRRPVIFHRWGGLGSHRYQIGFSGDTFSTWPTLAFQPYFTATAANVGFGYWGHDIGGHLQSDANNPELYLRWLQYGAFSPIFRTHAASDAHIERRIWKYDNFEQLRDAVVLRYAFFPYIYTYAREAYDTGVSLCRPLYYEWPEVNNAYIYEDEYLFGNDVLVAPILAPVGDNGLARRTVWLPEGDWYDVVADTLVKGDVTFAADYTLDDIPYFYRAGSIIPHNPHQRSVMVRPDSLILHVIPGADGSFSLYEDSGDDQRYIEGEYTRTLFTQQRTGTHIDITVAPREGSFPDMPESRTYAFVLHGLCAAPAHVTSEGKEVPSTDIAYDAASGTATLTLHDVRCAAGTTLHVEAPSAAAIDRQELEVRRSYEPYTDSTTAKGWWITGSAVPGGTQQLQPYPDGTYRFHGSLTSGTLRIMNTPVESASTRYANPRYSAMSIITDGSTATRTLSTATEWIVPFTEDRYRFTYDPSHSALSGELFTLWGELYIIGGCMAEDQSDQWHVSMALPFTRAEGNPHVFYWTGQLRYISGNVEPRRFKLTAQKDWGPRALHPFTQDEPLLTSTMASEVNDDNKWSIAKNGWYTLTVDVFRETIHADYLGEDYTLPDALLPLEADDEPYGTVYDLSGRPLCTPPTSGIVVTRGKKVLIRP